MQMWLDLGSSLTCSEVEPLCWLLAALGLDDAASALFDAHAEADTEDDRHFGVTWPLPS